MQSVKHTTCAMRPPARDVLFLEEAKRRIFDSCAIGQMESFLRQDCIADDGIWGECPMDAKFIRLNQIWRLGSLEATEQNSAVTEESITISN